MLKTHSLIINNGAKANLYREHDQDVSNDSDQTQRSGHQDDEHILSGVRASREEAGAVAVG